MTGSVICILSDVRSGSTLFGQLLNAHSQITLAGELQWLPAYVLNDRRYYNPPFDLACACGEPFANCDFWQSVSAVLNRPLADLTVMPRFLQWVGPGAEPRAFHERGIRWLIESYPELYRLRTVQRLFNGHRVATDNMAIFDAILRHTGTRYVVDTSKRIFRFRTLYEWYPHRLQVIMLQRDYRAVIHSRMKRGISLEDAARQWKHTAKQIEIMTAGIPSDKIIHLQYEALCTGPESELRRICGFLNLEFEVGMLRRPTDGLHDLGGSSSKLQSGRAEIRLDSEYLEAFSSAQLDKLQQLIGQQAGVSAGEDRSLST